MSIQKWLKAKNKQKISLITAYDYLTAKLVAKSKIDAILVGDSLGNVYSGYKSTLPVTMDEMLYHVKAVRRGAPDTFIIADMPFGSYGISEEFSVQNAVRFLKEGGANAVKLEGGLNFAHEIQKMNQIGIPVMGHIGLKPQSVELEGYQIHGKTEEEFKRLMDDARALVNSGVFAIVIEGTLEETAKSITEMVPIPTIGIGAGRYTDGQVLVITDLIGLDLDARFKHNKVYCQAGELILNALNSYADEVALGAFPTVDHVFNKE